MGAIDSDIPAQYPGVAQLEGKRERGPAQQAKDSDIPAQSSGEAHGGVVRDTLDTEKGKRERAPATGVTDSDILSLFSGTHRGGDAMDASETESGKRERAPVEGAAGSDIPAQSADKKCPVGDLHFAFVADKEVAKEHARRRRSDMRGKIDSQTRKGPGASYIVDGEGPILSPWVAEECNRVSG